MKLKALRLPLRNQGNLNAEHHHTFSQQVRLTPLQKGSVQLYVL
jgi:hypothetical protein